MSANTATKVGSSSADYQNVINHIYEHLEQDHVDRAVLTCLRLARMIQDYVHAALFLREMGFGTKEVVRSLYDDMVHLNPDAMKFVSERSLDQWLNLRTLDFSLGLDKKGHEQKVFTVAIGELDAELTGWEGSITDLSVPPGMSPFDTAAFQDSYQKQKAQIRLRMKAVHTVKQRTRAFCQNYAVGVERQVLGQRKSRSFLEQTQNVVNNYFKAHCDSVFTKLQKSAQLIDSTNSEDFALLLTEVRRAVKASADYFYPPKAGKILCSDGKERELGDDQYLNRLNEYLAVTFPKSSATELLQAEFEYLCTFARRLNTLASKGVHADVSIEEAKQGLLGLYMFLYNVIARLDEKQPSTGEAA